MPPSMSHVLPVPERVLTGSGQVLTDQVEPVFSVQKLTERLETTFSFAGFKTGKIYVRKIPRLSDNR